MRFLLLIICCLCPIFIFAQDVSLHIGSGSVQTTAGAQFDATDRGVLIPRMTEEEKFMITNPATGLLVFDYESDSFWYFKGPDWIELTNTDFNLLEDSDGDTKVYTEENSINKIDFKVGSGIVAFINNSIFNLPFATDLLMGESMTGNGEKLFFDFSLQAFRMGEIGSTEWDSSLLGLRSFAFGENTIASGNYSAAWGQGNVAAGEYSTAFGSFTDANGNYSITCGSGSQADGTQATAFGTNGSASGNFSTCFGSNNISSGAYSTAYGFSTKAMENSATSFGALTEANGSGSTAMGLSSIANGVFSTAIGSGVVAESYGEAAFGRYNTTYTPNSTVGIDSDDRVFIVGNGTSNANRKDAFYISKSGEVTSTGNIVSFPRPGFNTSSISLLVEDNQDGWEFKHENYALSINHLDNNISDKAFAWSFDGYMNIGNITGSNMLNVAGQASKSSAGAWLGNSDSRLKKEIETIESSFALSQILEMQGVQYEWDENIGQAGRPTGMQYGFIAQDLEKLWPEKVSPDGAGYLETAYGDYEPMFVESFKAQQDLILKLEEKQVLLKGNLATQAEVNNQIKERLDLLNKEAVRLLHQYQTQQSSSETSAETIINITNIRND